MTSDVVVRARPSLAVVSSSVVLLAGALLAVTTWTGAASDPLFFVLIGVALLAQLITTSVDAERDATVSGAFLCVVLAIGFLDPFCAFAIGFITTTVWLIAGRYRWQSGLVNLAGTATPDALAAWGVGQLHIAHTSAVFPLVLAGVGACVLLVNVVFVDVQINLLDGVRQHLPSLPRDYFIATGLNIALAAALAAVYAQTGLAVIAFALLIVLAFAYMTRLVTVARARTREYANLSWGVLSSLVRTLDERDHRAARHCAAVARFSRDIAARSGMSEREQELAHTAGLLHDIGRFALSDRVLEPEGELTQEDWRVVRLHPTIGASLLQDIGVYGPVAEIVLAHHERIDGRGYPNGVAGDEIPAIARIVAVAEVYDTLTAPDTYRERMTSFEALTELRRVAGRQLDDGYVEILAQLLAGQGTDYRHADEADYDRELDIERRLNEAAAT
jgi:putative nucleotidyltransferase with HDIG domain